MNIIINVLIIHIYGILVIINITIDIVIHSYYDCYSAYVYCYEYNNSRCYAAYYLLLSPRSSKCPPRHRG